MEVKKFESSSKNVWKYVFHFEGAIAEAVLYKYESFSKRTVMCVSVQCGCPVGCTFCGTGSNFVRNLTSEEILHQVQHLVKDAEDMEGIENSSLNNRCENFQIMFMSMGEPMLNWKEVEDSIKLLNAKYKNAQLLLSTIGVDNEDVMYRILNLGYNIKKLGLQISIHDAFDEDRNKIIPVGKKLSLRHIRTFGLFWSLTTGRPLFLNYCITDESSRPEKLERLMDLFDPEHFKITFSVVCETKEGEKSCNDMQRIEYVRDLFLSNGYSTKTFDPAGKDDIGGGCGQLWYVQKWMEENKSS